MNSIDLHIHSTCSDGTLSPTQIIDEAIKNNVNIISITDHDSMEAYSQELFEYAKTNHVKLIPGVEISTTLNKIGFHILGYNIDIHHKALKQKLTLLKNARHDYLHNVSFRLKQLGYVIHEEELNQIDIVTKAHIANDIINNPQNKDLLFKTFQHTPNMGEFIETIMNEGCPAYIKKETMTPQQASQLIKQAGGKVVLAHPVCYQYEDNVSSQDIIQLINDIDADGIEAIYIYIDKDNHKINKISKWKQIAKDNHLFITMGSDFHRFDHIHPHMGLINEDINISHEDIIQMIQHIYHKSSSKRKATSNKKTSRYISFILRHHPEAIGITLDEHGWANVQEFIDGVNKVHPLTMELLENIVATNDKQRFSFNEDKTLIRANQGHSIPVDVELEEVIPPKYLYHGTGEKYVTSIDKQGLLRKSRLYVHLSKDIETATKVGTRHGNPVIYRVSSQDMYQQGYKFYLSVNGVWLIKSVPKQYLYKL